MNGVPAGFEESDDDDMDLYVNGSFGNPSFVEKFGRIRVLEAPGFRAGLDKRDFNTDLAPEDQVWFDNLVRIYQTYKTGPMVSQMIRNLYIVRPNMLEVALKVFARAPDFSTPKTSSLAYQVIKELHDYLKTLGPEDRGRVYEHLNDNLRMVAFNFFHKTPALFSMALIVYDFSSSKLIFLDRVKELLEEHKYKEVCQIALELKLQEHFGIHEFLVPLILQDKMSVAEAYLAKTPAVARELVIFLDSWLDYRERFVTVYDVYLAGKMIPEVNFSKLRRKTLKKLVKRFADMYGIPKKETPFLVEMDSYGLLKRLIEEKFQKKKLDDWDEFIQEHVRPSSSRLIDELINACIDYDDLPEAAKWVKFFKLDASQYSSNLAEFMAGKLVPERKISAPKVPLNVTYYSIDRAMIEMVDVVSAFHRMLATLTRYKLLAFDVEWKFGDSNVCLIQIATPHKVFLVDVKQLKLGTSEWRKLGQEFFNNEEIIKLGFSQDGDMAVLKKALPQLGLMYEKSHAFIDLRKLWVFMQDSLKFQFPHKLPPSKDTEKTGLRELVTLVLGKPLNKDQQLSNWGRRPLSERQILYAASDAYCLLEVFEVFNGFAEKQGYDLTSYELLKFLK